MQNEGNVQDDVSSNASDCSCDNDVGVLAARMANNVREHVGDLGNGHDGGTGIMMGQQQSQLY